MRYILLLACGHWMKSWFNHEPADGDTHTCMRDGLVVAAVYLPDRSLDALIAPVRTGETP